MTELYERIKEARRRAELTQEDVAKRCGLTRNAVTLWESSRAAQRTSPQIPEIRIICEATGAPVEWLLYDTSGLNDDWGRVSHFSVSAEEKTLVQIFRDCDSDQRKSISAFMQFTAATSTSTM
jgi:transcriptional regulator with XRE-family HTH domain